MNTDKSPAAPQRAAALHISATANGWTVDVHDLLNECFGSRIHAEQRYVFQNAEELGRAVVGLLTRGTIEAAADSAGPSGPSPGNGYRWVNKGETLLPSDEYPAAWTSCLKGPGEDVDWKKTGCGGEPAIDGKSYRRKV